MWSRTVTSEGSPFHKLDVVMNGFPCMDPDLSPGRLNGRRHILEDKYYGCDVSSVDDLNSEVFDILPESTVYE